MDNMNFVIKFENGQLSNESIENLANCERAMKKAKEQYDQIKANLLEAMEQNGVVKIDTPELQISYVAPTESERFDSKALKEVSPELYDQFVKFTPVKASIRIKVK